LENIRTKAFVQMPNPLSRVELVDLVRLIEVERDAFNGFSGTLRMEGTVLVVC
jgi:hypothetical protein